MLIDAYNKFAQNLNVFGAAGTILVGDVMDLKVARDIGEGQPLFLNVHIVVGVTGGTSWEFKGVSDAQEAIAVDGSATQHVSSGAIPVAQLVPGFILSMPLPNEGPLYERFLGVTLTRVGTSTTGSVWAYLSPHAAGGWRPYKMLS